MDGIIYYNIINSNTRIESKYNFNLNKIIKLYKIFKIIIQYSRLHTGDVGEI